MDQAATITVIDDDASLRAAMMGLMRSAGHAVEGYASAEAFLASAAESRSDCIVTDIQMPGLSGIDLKLALDRGGRKTPVIMITARPEPAVHARAQASGAFCLLRKPFESDELLSCVDRALRIDGRAAEGA